MSLAFDHLLNIKMLIKSEKWHITQSFVNHKLETYRDK